MTNLQTVPTKTTPAEIGGTDVGNFFQMPSRGIGGNFSNPDFDSFLENREYEDQAEELREEQEAAKKRKKPVEAGLATPPPQQEVLLQELEGTAAKGKDNNVLDAQQASNLDAKLTNQSYKPEVKNDDKTGEINTISKSLETTEPQKSTDSLHLQEALPTEDQIPSSKNKNIDTPKTPESESDSRGIESASIDTEMIASATLDSVESPGHPLLEPPITSINRLTTFASLEQSAVAPVTGSGSSSESGIGNPANGLALSSQLFKGQTQSPSAQASALFKSLGTELDKFKQTGSSQIQLDLPVGENESVRIKLSIRGGEIRSTFITESPELREALQKAWPEFSQHSRDRGFRIGDPAFQQSFQESSANLGQNDRRQSETGTREANEGFVTAPIRKSLSKPSQASNAQSTALWA
jgi:hypothetical protein